MTDNGTTSPGPDWPPLPSPLDPFLRRMLRFIENRDGVISHNLFVRERPDDGHWPPGFLEVILTSARARGFIRTIRNDGQTRHHHLTETGRRWIAESEGLPGSRHDMAT